MSSNVHATLEETGRCGGWAAPQSLCVATAIGAVTVTGGNLHDTTWHALGGLTSLTVRKNAAHAGGGVSKVTVDALRVATLSVARNVTAQNFSTAIMPRMRGSPVEPAPRKRLFCVSRCVSVRLRPKR